MAQRGEDPLEDATTSAQTPQVASELCHIQYNHMMMTFLQTQLAKVHDLQKPSHASSDSAQWFDLQIATGERLLARHAAPFNLRDFYTVGVVQDSVKSICQELKTALRQWGMHAAEKIASTLSIADVRRDRGYLCSLVRYILTGDCSNSDAQFLQQWHKIKRERDSWMVVKMVNEKDIELRDEVGEGGWGTVHVGEWLSGSESSETRKVAVKVPKYDLPVDDVAMLIREAVVQVTLNHSNVAKLHAATITGWLVMELANQDLQQVCDREMLDWRLKRNLLLQGVAGVDYMHSQSPVLVHADLKPANFLVFGSQPGSFVVKVSDFGQTFEMRGNRSKTIRKAGGTPRWVAPEIYEEKTLTKESDVYSFGLVMYEVVTGIPPYRGAGEYGIMSRKLKREEPCNVRPSDCPWEMLSLMRHCCQLDPQDRPSMAEIGRCLEDLPEDWKHGTSSAGGQASFSQGGGRRQDMVSQTWRATIKDIELEELEADPGLLVAFRSRLGAVMETIAAQVTGLLASLSVGGFQRGSVVLMIEVDFSGTAAADWFKDHMEQCGMETRDDVMLHGHRPEMTLVKETCTNDVQVPELKNQLWEVMAAVSNITDFQYGHSTMRFLQSRIRGLEQNPLKMPGNAVEDEWRHDLTALLYDMKELLRLVRRHNTLNTVSFERTADTCAAVEHVLKAIRSLVHKWDLPSGANIDGHTVPAEHVENDRRTLGKLLTYIYEEGAWPFLEVDAQERQQWEPVKKCLQGNMGHLPVIPDDEIVWDEQIAENVYGVTWGSAQFAAKQLVPTEKVGLSLEDFHKLHTDASLSSLDPRYCVKLHRVTRSGAILMDRARSNLQQWYMELAAVGIEARVFLKLGVLAQAARALLSVHAFDWVYGNVKSNKFLLFGDDVDDCVIKLASMPSMVEFWRNDCIYSPSSGRWMANELYDRQAVSFKSDVYGFGCIVYETVMEDVPFGRSRSELEVLKAKMAGKQPFTVPEDISRQWPVEVLALMQQCCSSDPRERPSMETVDHCFQQWHHRGHEAQGCKPPWNNLPLPFKDTGVLLLQAAQRGNTAEVEALLDGGASIEAVDKARRTPLHMAAKRGHAAAIEALVARGAQTEAVDDARRTALHMAAERGHARAIEALVARGARTEAVDVGTTTPLHLAAEQGHAAAIEALVARGAQIEAVASGRRTPLHLAAWGGHAAAIEALVARGAQIEAFASGRRTPLHLAAWGGHAAAIEALVARGAQTEAVDDGRRTPLHLAGWEGHAAAIEALVARGAQTEAVDDYQNTPLRLAEDLGHASAAEALAKATWRQSMDLGAQDVRFAGWGSGPEGSRRGKRTTEAPQSRAKPEDERQKSTKATSGKRMFGSSLEDNT